MKKKLFGLVLLGALMLPQTGIHADTYNPIDIENHWAEEELIQFNHSSLLQGYKQEDGTHEMKPDASITRAEFVSILNRALELEMNDGTVNFVDVKDGWYKDSVYIAASNQLVHGVGNNTFEPNRPITRAEIASILVRGFEEGIDFSEGEPKNFTDTEGHWADATIDQASRAGIVAGTTATTFNPNRKATRAESVVMIKRAMDKDRPEKGDKADAIALVDAYNDKHKTSLDTEDTEGLADLEKKTMGYYEVIQSIRTHYDTLAIEDEGVTYSFDSTETPSPEITHLSNYFAEARIDEGEYDVTITRTDHSGGERSKTYSYSDEAVYKLRKTQGQWKIYDISPAGY